MLKGYDKSNRLLKLKTGTSETICGVGEDGEYVITFAPALDENIVQDTSYYKVFVFMSLTSAVLIFEAVKVLETQN